MSADNWRTCPACAEIWKRRKADAIRDAESRYGTVSAADYRMEFMAAQNLSDEPPEDTLREDWEIGLVDDGTQFTVSYRASCDECGFLIDHDYCRGTENEIVKAVQLANF